MSCSKNAGRRDRSPQVRADKMKDRNLTLDPVTWFQGSGSAHVTCAQCIQQTETHQQAMPSVSCATSAGQLFAQHCGLCTFIHSQTK